MQKSHKKIKALDESGAFLYKNVKTDFCIKVSLRHLSFTILCIFYPFSPIIVHFSKKEYRILQ